MDPDLTLIIAAHDELNVQSDPRIEVVQVDFPHVAEVERGFGDKVGKLRTIGALLKSRNYRGYIMPPDTDDLVSRHVVGHVRSDDNRRGYLFRQGYRLDTLSGNLGFQVMGFDKSCGSCFVGWFEAAELPTDPGDGRAYFSKFKRHTECFETARDNHRLLANLPLPGAVYVLNHGESLRSVKIGHTRPIGAGDAVPGAATILAEDFAFALATNSNPDRSVSPTDRNALPMPWRLDRAGNTIVPSEIGAGADHAPPPGRRRIA